MKELPKSFNDLIHTSERPVLVDFYADWCGPCKMVSPIIQKLAKEFSGRMTTIKINTDRKQEIAIQYQIQGIPTIMFFYKGKTLFRLVGAQSYDVIKNHIVQNLPAV